MERIVIAAYRPLKGKEEELKVLMRTHWEILHYQGLVTDRRAITAASRDGTIIEMFGWKSREAIESAHTNPVVLEMWGKYTLVCEYVPIGRLEESQQLFSEFSPLD